MAYQSELWNVVVVVLYVDSERGHWREALGGAVVSCYDNQLQGGGHSNIRTIINDTIKTTYSIFIRFCYD